MGNTEHNIFLNIVEKWKGDPKVGKAIQGMKGLNAQLDKQTTKAKAQNRVAAKMGETGKGLNKREKLFALRQAESEVAKKKLQRQAKSYGLTEQNFTRALGRENIMRDKNGKFTDMSTGKSMKQEQVMKRVTRASQRFKMELLGVMFFGMGVARVFGSITRHGLEASGALGVFSTVAMLATLPTSLKLTKIGMKLLNFYDKLPKGMKSAISSFIFFGQALGVALMVVGAFLLGMVSLGQFIPSLGVAIKTFGAGLGGLKWLWATKWLFGQILSIGIILISIIAGIWNVTNHGLGKSAMKVGKGVLQVLVPIIAVIGAIIAGLTVGWAIAIGAIVAGGIYLLAKWKPVGIFFAWLGKLVMGIVGAIGAVFTSQTISGAWNKAWNTPTGLAEGGIVSKPTLAMIGEAGPEAVVPLSGGGGGLGGTTFSPTINVNNPVISNGMDVRNIGNQINDILFTELRRLGIR